MEQRKTDNFRNRTTNRRTLQVGARFIMRYVVPLLLTVATVIGLCSYAKHIDDAHINDTPTRSDNNETNLAMRDVIFTSVIAPLMLFAWLIALFTRSSIKHRKQAEEEMRKLHTAVEQSPAAIVITDVDGNIEYVNPVFTEITGYTSAEAIGQNPRILKSGRLNENFYRNLWKTILSGKIWRGEFHNKKKNGQSYWENATIAPVKDTDGNITQFIAVKEDITLRKQAEKELRKAKETAEAASKSKGEFLANMSHEIRTPMNGIMGMLDFLMETELNYEQREYAKTISNSADALLTLINDILDFSKIEAGKLDIELIPFDLLVCIEEMTDLLAAGAAEKNLEFILRCATDVPRRIIGDPGRIRQIITNFVGNAVKFTETGHVLINIECRHKNDTNALLRFSVEDTGIGIAADKLEHIFGKFTQADTSTTRRFGGTGLGLAICKQLVELMDGHIDVTSEINKGATFEFTISVPIDPDSEKDPLCQADLTDIRILIVDHYEMSRNVLQEQLTNHRIHTDTCTGGLDAMELLRQDNDTGNSYQMIIINCHLDDMDPEELARRIKADPELAEIVLIFLSPAGYRGDARRMAEIGFAAYLSKPVRPSQLIEALAGAWGARHTDQSSELITRHTITESHASKNDSTIGPEQYLGINALVVEDHLINQKVAVQLLEMIGCHVDVAANGLEALKKNEQGNYDIIFMDCQMPKMDGYDASREIRRREKQGSHTPIIAMTANAMQGDRRRCLDAGMDDYAPKPIKRDMIRDLLAKHCNLAGESADTTKQEHDAMDTPPPPEPIFDPKDILESLDGDVALLQEIVQDFLDLSITDIQHLRNAISSMNTRTAEQWSHKIKGSAASIGAPALADTAKRLEQSAHHKDYDAIGTLFTNIEQELDRLCKYLEQFDWDTVRTNQTEST